MPSAVSRRAVLGSVLAGALATRTGVLPAAAATSTIVKPLPPEWFTVLGTNAETRFEALRGAGELTPAARFFVRNHTATPLIDATTWRLRIDGDGVRHPLSLRLRDLRQLPAEEVVATIECTGNGRSFFTGQQGETVKGTAWKLGAIGAARWRGVRLSTVLRLAGVTRDAVSVLPAGLDDDYVDAGVNHGRVRRPLPIDKAMDDVLLAYEMNGRPLPPDHGFPLRVVVPGWIGIASIKWLGSLTVSTAPQSSPWDTVYYRYFGPGYPDAGSPPLTTQVVKSAFELPFPATLAAGERTLLTGRSWSGTGAIRSAEVSTDGGATWRRPKLLGPSRRYSWVRWELPWTPAAGRHELLARATDRTGATQPDRTRYNTLGYLFDAVVRHPVTAA